MLWQVGTNDAFAQVPVEEFQETVGETVRWLKQHNVDVILVGLHYMKQPGQGRALPGHPRQPAAHRQRRERAAHRPLRGDGGARAHHARERPAASRGDFGSTEAGYNCMAQYVARAIAVGLFAKAPKR